MPQKKVHKHSTIESRLTAFAKSCHLSKYWRHFVIVCAALALFVKFHHRARFIMQLPVESDEKTSGQAKRKLHDCKTMKKSFQYGIFINQCFSLYRSQLFVNIFLLFIVGQSGSKLPSSYSADDSDENITSQARTRIKKGKTIYLSNHFKMTFDVMSYYKI